MGQENPLERSSQLNPVLIDDRTQQSFDVLTEISRYFKTEGITKTGETRIHDQKNSLFCQAFATINGFDRLLKNLRSEYSVPGIQNTPSEIKPSFEKMLAVFFGAGHPRTYRSDIVS